MTFFAALLASLLAQGVDAADTFGPLTRVRAALPPSVAESAQATRRFYSSFSGDKQGHCSGAFTSKDGYFLTALHCLDLKSSSHLHIDHLRLGGGVLRSVHLTSKGPRLQRQALVNDPDQTTAKIDAPRLIAVGAGNQIFPINRVDLLSKDDLDAANQVIADFAILKFTGRTDYPCVSISTEEVPEERLFVSGFPLPSEKSKGDEVFVSAGERVASYTANFAAPLWEADQPVRYQTIPIRYPDLYMKDRYGFGRMDSMGGMSGGPVLNENGSLVGVLESRVGEFTNFVSARFVKSALKVKLGPDRTSQIFSCPRGPY